MMQNLFTSIMKKQNLQSLLSKNRISSYNFSTASDKQNNENQVKTAVFMLNLGGPENVEEITPFLERLFSDRTVIRIPFGMGKYIGRFRGPAKVAKQYEQIGGGSPIKKWTIKQGEEMMKYLNLSDNDSKDILVTPGFRYSEPLCDRMLEKTITENPDLEQIILFSQYPQWSCSTVGNNVREALKVIQEKKFPMQKVKIIDRWYTNEHYVEAMSQILYEDLKQEFEKQLLQESKNHDLIILFSAHSLPVDFVQQGDPYNLEIGTTANLVIQRVHQKIQQNLNSHKQIPFRVVWQSKVGFQDWLKPNTADALEHYSSIYKNAIVVPLGFAQDHLETLYELDLEYLAEHKEKYQKIFRSRSLNDHPLFIKTLGELLKTQLPSKYLTEEEKVEKNKNHFPSSNFGLRCPNCFCKDDCNIMNEYLKQNEI